MEENIKQINDLDRSIKRLKDFLWILESSNINSKYGDSKNPKRNEFISIYIESALWTGTQNPYYSKSLTSEDRDLLNDFGEVMKIIIKSKITEKETKLKSLVNHS